MSCFVLHSDAVADLEEIWEFIGADSLEAADRVPKEIYEAIRALVPFPKVDNANTQVIEEAVSPSEFPRLEFPK